MNKNIFRIAVILALTYRKRFTCEIVKIKELFVTHDITSVVINFATRVGQKNLSHRWDSNT